MPEADKPVVPNFAFGYDAVFIDQGTRSYEKMIYRIKVKTIRQGAMRKEKLCV